MEKSSLQLIKEWQKALQAEIAYLKKYGSKKYLIINGRKLIGAKDYTYYFDCNQSLSVPNGSKVKIHWGSDEKEGRILSSEGKGVIVVLDEYLGDYISESYLMYDPWQLLDELSTRLSEIKKSKNKRARIKRLLSPEQKPKHPIIEKATSVKELYVRSKYNPVTFVWGPPGTGKTYTLARVAANKYLHKQKVLILAQSNAAVDVLMNEVYEFLNKTKNFKVGEILRYGSQVTTSSVNECITIQFLLEKQDPSLSKKNQDLIKERQLLNQDLHRSFSNRDSQKLLELENKIALLTEKMKRREKDLLKDADIIGATLAKAATDSSVYENTYDLVIVDEASMCYIPQAAFAASLAKRVIICGDFKQLPPIAQSKHSLVTEWLKEDIFHKAGVVENVDNQNLHPQLLLLNEQRRMHPEISSFTNKYVYHSLVHDHMSVKHNRREIIKRGPFHNKASILLDTSFTGPYSLTEKSSNSRWNPWHLLLSFQLIYEAYMDGARSIGYVTPYRAQAEMMNVLIEEFFQLEHSAGNIIAATVHKFQGSEKEVIIFDSVDGRPFERPGMLLIGKESERLINVAITRTKGKFIHVNNREYTMRNVSRLKTLRKLVDHQIDTNQVITHQEIGNWIKNHHQRIQWIHARKVDAVFDDLLQARSSIILSIPAECHLPKEWVQVLSQMNKKVKLTIISSENLKINCSLISEQLPFPFVLIDQKYLWIGQPFEHVKGLRPPNVAVKINSSSFAEQFLFHLPIEYNW